MWIAALAGVAFGIFLLIILTVLRDRRLRRLFADDHLLELARALADARTGPITTSGGLTLSWRPLKAHSALVIAPRRRLPSEAVRFLFGAIARATGRDITAALALSNGNYGLVFPGPVPSVVASPEASSDPDALGRWRSAGVEAMRSLAVLPGALSEYDS